MPESHVSGTVHIDGIFPVAEVEHGFGAEAGPWFNWAGKRAVSRLVLWDIPGGGQSIEGIEIPCPSCGRPFIFSGLNPQGCRFGDDGQLTFNTILRCSGFWQQVGESGDLMYGTDGRPIRQACGWVALIREGIAHHPQCPSLHQAGCPHPGGPPCRCRFSRVGGAANCVCGAISPGQG